MQVLTKLILKTLTAIHSGSGKGQLINAILLLNEFLSMLPENDNPYHSSEHDGYWHIDEVNGNAEVIEATMILRDFDMDKLVARENAVINAINTLNEKYPTTKSSVIIKNSYYNMYPYIMKKPEVVEKAKTAIAKNGLTPSSRPIRGGTDGATFSKMGLPTPNLGTGSYNHHGRYEYLVIQDFLKMIDIVVDIFRI